MKKRYYLPLTIANVDRFHAIMKQAGMQKGVLAVTLDDALKEIVAMMDMVATSKPFTVADMFKLMGEQFEKIQEEKHDGGIKKRSASKVRKRATG